jgi:phosphatidylinositol glycan class M
MNFSTIVIIALVMRLVLIIYGEYQDAHYSVHYTDIDYHVFTDAAQFLHNGGSPYQRATYRYTPLLALILVPNLTLHQTFGKLLFSACDIGCGTFIYKILRHSKVSATTSTRLSALWLLNPLVANISTRGSAESILGVLVLATAYTLLTKRLTLSALLFGLAVHVKIYPIIYAWPIWLFLDNRFLYGSAAKTPFITRPRLTYGFTAATVFLGLNVWMYALYGYEFLHETYLYHVTRQDHRHNFSPWFYVLYLTAGHESSLLRLVAFVPQFLLVTVVGYTFYKDLVFAWFMQTVVFVAYNKVCTSQYFLWYLCMLPIILPRLNIPFLYKGLTLLVSWILAQALWLNFAFQLELRAINTFPLIWLSSLTLFIVSNWCIVEFIDNYKSRIHID